MTRTQGENPRRLRPVAAALLVLPALGVAGLAAYLLAAGAGEPWLVRALTSRDFVLAASVGLGSLAGLTALALAAFRSGRGRRRAGQDGTAMLEFALVLPIALMLVLLMTQSALLMAGNLCVHYSAYCAARSAIVTVPDDVDGEPPNVYVGWGGPKWHRINQAAIWALLPVCSSSNYISPDTDATDLANGLEQFFYASGAGSAPGWAGDADRLARRLTYAEQYTTVELAPPAGAAYGQNEDLAVTVEHTYYLSVPYAAWLYAEVLDKAHGRELAFGAGEYGLDISASCKLTNEGVRDSVEIDKLR